MIAMQIVNAAAIVYGIDPRYIKSRHQYITVVHARQAAIFLIKEETKQSLAQIGRFFKQDHSTIIHSYRRILSQVDSDPTMVEKIAEMKRLYSSLRSDGFVEFDRSTTPSYGVVVAVATVFKMKPEEILSKEKKRQTVLARNIAIYLIATELHRSHSDIGCFFYCGQGAIRTVRKRIKTQMTASVTLREIITAAAISFRQTTVPIQ